MTKQLKKRISAINSGIVPKGYKKTKVGIVPVEWEVEHIGKHLQEYRELSNDIEKYPVYSSSRKGLIPQSDYYDKEAVQTNLGYKIVPVGYVTYRHMSDDDIFHFNYNLTDRDVLVSSEYPVFNAKKSADLYYIITSLNEMNRFRYFCRSQKMGGTRTRLYFKNLSTYRMAFPPLREQQKIAEILSTQDKMIELQEKKIEQLKELKKAYLQKMFPQKGSKYPEIRFKGFTEAWEQRKLGELIEDGMILEQSDGNHGELYPRNEEFTESGIPYISAANIATDGESVDFNSTKYLPIERAIKFRKGITKNGDILLAHNATVGPCLRLSMDFDFAVLSTSLTLFRVDESKMDPDFFLQMLRSERFQSQLIKLMKQTTRNQVPILTQRGIGCCFSNNSEEQKKIGNFLKDLDNLITLHQRKWEEEKQKKKSLMQLLLTGKVRVKL